MTKIVKTTLSEQIYNILRNDIINQTIKCGEKLTLKALQERFDLSSTPIRDAMNRLSREGLIEHVTNVGAKVVDLGKKDIKEIYDFCAILDVNAMKLALENENTEQLKSEINQNIILQEESLEINDMQNFILHSDNFHDIFFQYANNSRLYDAALKIRSQFSILSTKYQNYTIAKSIVFIEHKNIVYAISHWDYDNAFQLMTDHFEHAKEYLLKNIKNID